MNDPRKKNPTFGVGVFIVVVVLFVIGTLVFNAVRGKREYDEANPAPAAQSQSGGAAAGTSASQAAGAGQ
jgi:heme/copper-type cytochrome/quinol oxidase subunit 2